MKPKSKTRYKANVTKLVIDELAGVDQGAQAEAGDVILKRKLTVPGQLLETDQPAAPTAIQKKSLLTSAVMGHTHLLMGVDDCMSGTTTSERNYELAGDSYSSYHSHPWVKDDNGTIVIGEAAGHTHEALGATTGVAKRGDDKETDMDKTKNEERLELELATARAYGQLTDMQKALYATLTDVTKKSFLDKSSAERDADVAKAVELDPVVVEFDGQQIRKSAGPTMIAIAKKAKENAETVAKRDEELTMERLEKRATKDLGNLPKTVKAKVAVLRAIDAIADEEVRKEAHEMLAAANGAFADVQKNIGHGGTPGATTAHAAWEAGLSAFAKGKNLSPVAATEHFLETPEGEELAEALEAERASN